MAPSPTGDSSLSLWCNHFPLHSFFVTAHILKTKKMLLLLCARKHRSIPPCPTVRHPNYTGTFPKHSCFVSNLGWYSQHFYHKYEQPSAGGHFLPSHAGWRALDCWQNFQILSRDVWPPSHLYLSSLSSRLSLMLKSAQTWPVGAPTTTSALPPPLPALVLWMGPHLLGMIPFVSPV